MKKMKYTLIMENGDTLVMEKKDFTKPFQGTTWKQGEKILYSIDSMFDKPEDEKVDIIKFPQGRISKKSLEYRQKVHDHFADLLYQKIQEHEIATKRVNTPQERVTQTSIRQAVQNSKDYYESVINLEDAKRQYKTACPTELDTQLSNKLFSEMMRGKSVKVNLYKTAEKPKGELVQFPK